ncbi:MAG: amidase [Rhodospirillales bacterium]|jgi:aspartyl-tRNA(Asn)/glutamyl-tRNA(Gln) amidotransferase subunit A|nr:amidase [Rhodospirillales bacterium]
MPSLPPDPLDIGGIAGFGRRLRKGDITAASVTEAYLARIEALDPRLGAYQHVSADSALSTARALDGLLAAGTDLGPLMGVPVAVKDIFAVAGMPTTAGSKIDVGDLIGPEGSFVRALRRAGCVILGKAKTVEFALGAVGTSRPRGTPWNPWDNETQRAPGGSSSGPAVAVAAGLAAFAIGSDTGGSVRLPAALCGTFGLKTTVGLWPTDGVFPLAPHLDSIGPLTRSAADAALVFAALTGAPAPVAEPLGGLRLGRPENYFFDNLDAQVESCTAAALGALEEAGVEFVPIDVPEASEREGYFPVALPACLIAGLGRERFLAGRADIDPVVALRGDRGLEVTADAYIRLERRREDLCRIAADRMKDLDGWVSPTAALVAPPVAQFDDPDVGLKLALAITQDTQPGNLFGQCGTSTPIQSYGSDLPVGLQIVCASGHDAKALSIALAVEEVVGIPPGPDLSGFAA